MDFPKDFLAACAVGPPGTPAIERRYLTTREAAAFCGYRTTGAIRKAFLDGRLRPAGRRGGRGTLVWSVAELERFLRGEPLNATVPEQ